MKENSIEKTLENIQNVDLITLLRKFKKEGVENFIVIRRNDFDEISSHYKRVLKENEKLKVELERQKDINTIINQKRIDKNYEKALEKSMSKFLKTNMAKDFVPVQKVKDKIEKEIKYHRKNILDIENITMLKGKTAKEEAEIEFNKYAIVVLKKMLQECLESEE